MKVLEGADVPVYNFLLCRLVVHGDELGYLMSMGVFGHMLLKHR